MKLLFVYNADSKLFSRLTDYVHKVISPNTYQCNLCAITYDNYGMKKEWKEFIKSLPIKSEFLHKDEYIKKYPSYANINLPAVLLSDNDILKEIASVDDLGKVKGVDEIKELLKRKVNEKILLS